MTRPNPTPFAWPPAPIQLAAFREEDHPRDEDGQFSEGAGASGAEPLVSADRADMERLPEELRDSIERVFGEMKESRGLPELSGIYISEDRPGEEVMAIYSENPGVIPPSLIINKGWLDRLEAEGMTVADWTKQAHEKGLLAGPDVADLVTHEAYHYVWDAGMIEADREAVRRAYRTAKGTGDIGRISETAKISPEEFFSELGAALRTRPLHRIVGRHSRDDILEIQALELTL